MQKKIVRRDYSPSLLDDGQHLHPLLQRIYAARNIASMSEVDRSLAQLLPYHTLSNIEKAAALLVEAIIQQQRILIVGDFDADGATSTAVAILALRSFGAVEVNFLVPNRFDYGYGLTPELVDAALPLEPAVIVTVDNGIANHAGVTAAKSHGISVIITDHHLTGTTLPEADAIVNPNQPGDLFPSKNLAGVGVIFYLMLALRKQLNSIRWFEKNRIQSPNMSRLLDLVALGTVADLVPLDRNNRILVYQGLQRIRAGQCQSAIIALLELADRDFSRASASDLAFHVASRLNAAGRLDDMSLGIECLLCEDQSNVRSMAKTLDQLNNARKNIEKEMQVQAFAALDHLNIPDQKELPRGLCVYEKSWHQGVIGILAARIKERFHRPVIAFAPGSPGWLKGSARSIAGIHIRDVLARIDSQYPNLILKFGGHAMAAGLTIAEHLFQEFMKVFHEVVGTVVSDADLQHILLTDGELQKDELSVEMAEILKEAGPWGQAFPEPMFDGAFKILEQRLVGDKHLKLRLAKENKILDAIHFFADTELWPNHRANFVRAVYRLDVNEYQEQIKLQLIIDYLEPLSSHCIE